MTSFVETPLTSQISVRGTAPAGFPTVPNTTAVVDGNTVVWLGPDEWLVLGGSEADFSDAAAAVDVSANRIAFDLSGANTLDVLASGCGLDLAEEAFAIGGCAQTLLARAQVILIRQASDAFRILVRPSFAPYTRAWLADAIAGSLADPAL
ncbi:MAG: sarcosine oxidase subunit gamma [Actinobacteria bacterium]|uniref:Unannotated protein n=1 Tax=freshwater metagenome TaxID=449393 RepID=A0A6J6QB01_9ZZZZ|nr:sarcosine oxidase subunit gamma [Actinomycetota bacterium]